MVTLTYILTFVLGVHAGSFRNIKLPPKTTTTIRTPKIEEECKFPFIYMNTTYNSCTWRMAERTNGLPWCSVMGRY